MTVMALFAGAATYLSGNGVGAFPPAESGWGISVVTFPQSPPLVVCLTPYHVGDEVFGSDSTEGMQVRVRGDRDPRTASDKADEVFDLLHGLSNVVIGGVPVVLVEHRSGTYLGPDVNGNHEFSANYYWQIARPTPLRTT